MGSEYYHLLRELGLEPEPFHPCLDIDGADAASAAAALRSAGVNGAFVALAPFTTRPQKHWLEERWRQLAGQVGSQCGLPVVVLGGPADRDAAERIFAGVARVTLLAGQLRLAETMAVIRQSALLIGVDTGLTHLGPAFARPTVALFGATCPYLETSRDHTVVIYHQQPCSPCRRSPTCAGQYPCMAAISVDEVLDQARQMLSTAGAPK
jgi:heptosyltransferase-1